MCLLYVCVSIVCLSVTVFSWLLHVRLEACDGVCTFTAVTAEYECFGVCLSIVCVCVAFVVGGSLCLCEARKLPPTPLTAPSPQPDSFPALLTWSRWGQDP